MSSQKRSGTEPEVSLRRALYQRGYRYRVGHAVPGLPRRTIDVTFLGPKVAVFVDGCFWHGCPCHFVAPKANAAWWLRKIEANVARDLATTEHLISRGWEVVRLWEHEPESIMCATVIGVVQRRR